MLFSIIIPIYKVESYLSKCIESVCSQTFDDYELILVDDGSPDNCPLLCDEWASRDTHIKVIHKSNCGLSSARNAGLDIAQGKYILFIDSDDFWCDDLLLEKLNERICMFEEDVILLGVKNVNSDGTEVITRGHYNLEVLNLHDKLRTFDELEHTRNYPGSAWVMCVYRPLIEKMNLRFKLGVTGEDMEWIFKLLINCCCIGAIAGIHYSYIQRDNSITSNPNFSFILGYCNAFDVYLKDGIGTHLLDTYVMKLYLQCVKNYNQLNNDDKIKAKSQLTKYLHILKICGAIKYYYVIKILGFSCSSYLVDFAYKKFYGYK